MTRIHCEPCPSGPHTHDEYENTYCPMITIDSPCSTFASLGYGPEGDFEHSCFCRNCGWELADHSDGEEI
jgi:hypothetical protein